MPYADELAESKNLFPHVDVSETLELVSCGKSASSGAQNPLFGVEATLCECLSACGSSSRRSKKEFEVSGGRRGSPDVIVSLRSSIDVSGYGPAYLTTRSGLDTFDET